MGGVPLTCKSVCVQAPTVAKQQQGPTAVLQTDTAGGNAAAASAAASPTAVHVHPIYLFHGGQLPKKGDWVKRQEILGHFATDACPEYGGVGDEAAELTRQEALVVSLKKWASNKYDLVIAERHSGTDGIEGAKAHY